MAAGSSTTVNSGKLPRVFAPIVTDQPSQFTCTCGLSFFDSAGLEIHQNPNTSITSHMKPLFAEGTLEIPVPFNRPVPDTLLRGAAPTINCEVCGRRFKHELGLRQHYGKKHRENPEDFRCAECGRQFKDRYAVKYHQRQVHSNERRVECELCGMTYYNKYVLQRHLKNCPERKNLAVNMAQHSPS